MSNEKHVPKLTRVLKGIIQRDASLVREGLDRSERVMMDHVERCLNRNRTGRYRPPTVNYDRLGQFAFFSLVFPRGGRNGFGDDQVAEYKPRMVDAIREHFGEGGKYELGFCLRPHFREPNVLAPNMHFHFVISRLRFLKEDSIYLNRFHGMSNRDEQRHVLYFLREPLSATDSELAKGFEPIWRGVMKDISNVPVPAGHPPLVNVSSREEQDAEDRKDVCEYLLNDPLHVFRDLWVVPGNVPGFVELLHVDKDTKKVLWAERSDTLSFVRSFLLLPNRVIRGVRWGPYGFLRNCRFTPVMKSALSCHAKLRGESVRLLDLPIEVLKMRASAYCRAYSAMGSVKADCAES